MGRGGENSLEPRTAAAVELHPRHIDAQAGVERRDAAEGRRFAVGIALPENHVVDVLGVDAGALDERGEHGCGERFDRHGLQRAAESSHGASQG